MSRYIDADELCEGRVSNDPVVIAAKCAQTADVEPVRHGHWERVNPANRPTATGTFKCSECGNCYIMRVFKKYNFCPHCGAKMDGLGKDFFLKASEANAALALGGSADG